MRERARPLAILRLLYYGYGSLNFERPVRARCGGPRTDTTSLFTRDGPALCREATFETACVTTDMWRAPRRTCALHALERF